MAQQLSCPTCGRQLEWSDAFPYRPFCSERCRLIDLGDWLTEKHVVPGESVTPDEGLGPESDENAPGGGPHGRA